MHVEEIPVVERLTSSTCRSSVAVDLESDTHYQVAVTNGLKNVSIEFTHVRIDNPTKLIAQDQTSEQCCS